eukprot:TRINITY_DN4815_c0_g3_i1.p1 TRINITY_DN4815_c0_g3~~TRINITY_DN4815_c0_g3_i1.p1  ORF type:complete len:257 (+),score=54.46 TRINITY_DN4815_c0_g3_i1:61-831(+)
MAMFTVQPGELYFPPPLTRPIENNIAVINQTGHPLIFKLKTTKPERYIVKPRMGFLAPNGQQAVQIQFRPPRKPPDAPLDPATLDDCFRVDVRALQGSAENTVFEKCQAQDFAGARQTLELADASAGSAGSVRDEAADVAATLWKTQLPVQRQQLKCHFTPDKIPKSIETKLEHRDGSQSQRSAVAPTSELQAKVQALTTQRADYYTKTQQQLAMQSELAGKSGFDGFRLSGTQFVVLWLLCFYVGLVMHRHLPEA